MVEYASKYELEGLKREFRDHLREKDEGFRRLKEVEGQVNDLNAEILGDERTGRLSVRRELNASIERNSELIEQKWAIMERRWKILVKVLVGVAIIAGGAVTVAAIRIAAVSYIKWPW